MHSLDLENKKQIARQIRHEMNCRGDALFSVMGFDGGTISGHKIIASHVNENLNLRQSADDELVFHVDIDDQHCYTFDLRIMERVEFVKGMGLDESAMFRLRGINGVTWELRYPVISWKPAVVSGA